MLRFLHELSKRSAGEPFLRIALSNLLHCSCRTRALYIHAIAPTHNRNLTVVTVVPFGTKFDADQEEYNLHIMRVLRVRNRFDPAIPEPKLLGGYRDIGLKLELGYSMTASGDVKFLPCKRWKANDSKFKVVLLLFAPVMRSNAFDTHTGQSHGGGTAATPWTNDS
jgi:hypothetical protein